jgi:hypothetical protein
MTIYRVCVRCDGLRVVSDGREVKWGFLKNEYVRALTRNDAAVLAQDRVRQQLLQEEAVNPEDAQKVLLGIELIESDIGFWKSLRREGFIFFDSTEADESL